MKNMNRQEEIKRLLIAMQKSKSPYLKRDYAKRISRLRKEDKAWARQ